MTKQIKKFTTSMNRKVCWEDGFKEGRKQALEDELTFLEDLTGKGQVHHGIYIIHKLGDRRSQIKKEMEK